MLNFDNHFGLGAVIEIILLGCGLVGGWVTMKVMQKVILEQLAKLQIDVVADRKTNADKHEENQKHLTAIDLQIARECVKIDDFRRLEERFATKFEKMEHVVRNAGMSTAGAIKDALRDVLRQREGRPE